VNSAFTDHAGRNHIMQIAFLSLKSLELISRPSCLKTNKIAEGKVYKVDDRQIIHLLCCICDITRPYNLSMPRLIVVND
jgi:hypothetical protein